ncbi:MAG: hypothetical protein ACYDA5_01665 [Vulcanimicrobiaceae bacterium]
MSSNNGDGSPRGPLELKEVLQIETDEGQTLAFEVVGVLEDPDDSASYAVLMHEGEDDEEQEFIVTDMQGNLLEDDELAQDILDEFLVFAEEAGDSGEG